MIEQLKFANRVNAKFVVIAGPDEAAAGKVTIKDLEKRTQITVDRNLLVETLKSSEI
ncbi:MAG: His/Gly/Thr/Pro-type tRNA ligase C-terminal domain-containing protein [Flexilinea sp.]